MAKIRIKETTHTTIPCPCGCGLLSEQHDGIMHFDQGGGYFRAVLMRSQNGEPSIWLSIATRGSEADSRDWMATLHGNQYGARIEDPEASPVAYSSTFSGRLLLREEVLATPGAPDFYFACFDALMSQHSRLLPFVLE